MVPFDSLDKADSNGTSKQLFIKMILFCRSFYGLFKTIIRFNISFIFDDILPFQKIKKLERFKYLKMHQFFS